MNASPESFSILAVCEGNVCRSPSAQFAMSVRLPGIRVESAGMRARRGTAVCEVVADVIAPEGDQAQAFAREFRSRRLDDVDLDSFHLVLTATAGIRAELTRTDPGIRDRFFTFREGADVLGAMVEADVRGESFDSSALVSAMNEYRGSRPTTTDLPRRLQLAVLDPLDIPDAHGDRRRRHRAVVDLALGSAASVGDSLARLSLA